MRRSGFTQIELLAVLAILAVLLAIIIPAVQSARETARNSTCRNNLRQLGAAMQSFEATHGVYPPGRENYWMYQTVFYTLLPHLDMQSLFAQFQYTWDGTEPEFQELQRLPIPILQCPSEYEPQERQGGPTRTSYAVNFGTGVQRYGYNGMQRPFTQSSPALNYRSGPIGVEDVHDGLSTTAAMSEWLYGATDQNGDRLRTVWRTPQLLIEPSQLEEFAKLCSSVPESAMDYGWRSSGELGASWLYSGAPSTAYNHVLTPGSTSCTNGTKVQQGAYSANSMHPGAVNVLYVDGHVDALSNAIDVEVWRKTGSRVEHDLVFPF
jgi:prepilin-type N-terminal cleavage/methylation domain-containing protein/prepilin-type processing-associated H-X9-DG protein